MRNPWLKRNPWQSMWLSAANAMFGAARAQAQRNVNRMMKDGMAHALGAWSASLSSAPKPVKRRARR